MPKEYESIPKILEISSRRVIVRALIFPETRRVRLALLTSVIHDDENFSIVFAHYAFREKTKGKIEEKIEIGRELGTDQKDLGIIRAMEKIMPGWEKTSPNWISNKERVLESCQGSYVPTTLNDRIHEAISRAQVRIHFEAQHVCDPKLSLLIQTFDQRLGAMLAENRVW